MMDVLAQFALDGKVVSCAPYGSGHINQTFLVETDAPFILPYCKDVIQPKLLRRARNTSLILPAVITKIAEIKECSPTVVEQAILENTVRVFSLSVRV